MTELAALGPYFDVVTHQLGHGPAAPWRPMTELVDHPEVLGQRIEAVRQILAAGAGGPPEDIEWRVAASTVHLGLVARLIAPAMALSALTDSDPVAGLADIFWQPVLGGPYPLSLPQSLRFPTEPADGSSGSRVAPDLTTWIVAGPIEQLTQAVGKAGSISDHVLRGNVASAVHSAAQQIVDFQAELAGRTTALVDSIDSRPSLQGTGRVVASGRYRRNSCCLIYRAVRPVPSGAGRAVCGDCVLAAG